MKPFNLSPQKKKLFKTFCKKNKTFKKNPAYVYIYQFVKFSVETPTV